jgi:hypothetical protein
VPSKPPVTGPPSPHELKLFAFELGWLGKLFGGKSEKAGNISGVVIVLCVLSLAVIWAVDTYIAQLGKHAEPAMPFENIFSGLLSVITLALGYLFGKSGNKEWNL